MSNLITYIESGVKIFFCRKHLRRIAMLSLKNEINYNLRIIAMIK